jgi:heme exporter protein B
VLAISYILTGEGDPWLWIQMLLGYDVIFTTIGVLLFETVLNAE